MSDMALNEHRRKRVRKGTKSCWECKRRKVRCDFLDSETVCAGCLDRRTKCVSQEFEDDQTPPSGSQLGQRMGRVEMLLEKLMQKVDAHGMGVERDHDMVADARESLGIDVLTPASSASNQYEGAPILSLFGNAVFGRGPGDGSSVRNDSAVYSTATSQGGSPLSQSQSKLERLRRSLVAMLPSQHDVDRLSDESDGWWLIRRHVLPLLVIVPDHDLLKPCNVQIASQSHPIVISRLLLVIAHTIQQLPPDYDTSRLHMAGSIQDLKEKIILSIATITSDDELIGSLEGIECLILQGVYHINAGNLRRSWLCFRRAMSVAQLMGLHRPSYRPNDPGDHQASRRQYLWFQLVKGDRFLSLILGVPSSGSSSEQFPFDDNVVWLNVEEKYNKQLCLIAGLIGDRNQTEPTHAFSTTQNIDERLDALAKQMPTSWWEMPASNKFVRSDQTANLFDRVVVHIWHYELESLVHLPYMLRAAVDRRYEYSRLSCLSASRKLVQSWIFLRGGSKSPFICKIVDFQAFKAAITLLLGILQPIATMKDAIQLRQEEEDRKLVENVRMIFEETQAYENDVVLAQSVEVLKTLQCVNQKDPKRGSIRLTIPHFGTISVGGSRCLLTAEGQQPTSTAPEKANARVQLDPALQTWQTNIPATQPVPFPTPPLLTFTSSQFPPLTADMGEWSFSNEDTLLFDSLLNTDLDGNWNMNF